MRLVLISDTHGQHENLVLPEGDVLILAGDMCLMGHWEELVETVRWLAAQPHQHKLVTAGNHDWPFQVEMDAARGLMLTNHLTYLEDDQIRIGGFKFYGSPWTPTFMDWAFMKARGPEIKQVRDRIPTGVDVLITHGPPYGILDPGLGEAHIGCEALLATYTRIRPRLHIFGHLHSGYGQVRGEQGTLYVNASAVNEMYDPVNAPVVVEMTLKDKEARLVGNV